MEEGTREEEEERRLRGGEARREEAKEREQRNGGSGEGLAGSQEMQGNPFYGLGWTRSQHIYRFSDFTVTMSLR